MNEKFQKILSALPEKKPRSRLEPYRELIGELRQRGRSYKEIAQILTERCELKISCSAVNDFVRLRARRKTTKSRTPDLEEALLAEPAVRRDSMAHTSHPKEDSPEEVWRRIEELKRRPLAVPEEPKKFHYNPDEPLHLRPKETKGDLNKS